MDFRTTISKEEALKEITEYLDEYSRNGKIRAYTLESIKYELRCNNNAMTPEIPYDMVTLEVNGRQADTSEDICDLIECLLMCDINVSNTEINASPEDHIRIEFMFQSDVDKFTKILFKGIDKNRDIAKRATESLNFVYNAWNWTAQTHVYEKKGTDIISNVDIEISVSFPRRDYEWILKKFKKYIVKHNL